MASTAIKCYAGYCVMFIGCALFVGTTVPAQSKKQSLVGTWRLVAYEDHLPSGGIEYPFGKSPVGLLTYDTDGYMMIQIMKTPHPKVASGDDERISVEEKVALFDSYTAYFGTYSVNWKKHIVTHSVKADMLDVFVSTIQKRPFELKGRRLTLTPRWKRADGTEVKGLRIFERVRRKRVEIQNR